MKKLILLVSAIIVSSTSFAGLPSTGLNKNSPQLRALASAWKAHPVIPAKQTRNNITIVYGGQDVSHRLTVGETANA